MKSLFITFVLGIIWFIFSATTHMFIFGVEHDKFNLDYDIQNDDENGHNTSTFIQNENWDFAQHSITKKVIIATYFALTTLSTTGLGDFYPVSDTERLVGSIFFLSGVALFSFIIGELKYMIANFLKLDSDVDS